MIFHEQNPCPVQSELSPPMMYNNNKLLATGPSGSQKRDGMVSTGRK